MFWNSKNEIIKIIRPIQVSFAKYILLKEFLMPHKLFNILYIHSIYPYGLNFHKRTNPNVRKETERESRNFEPLIF